MHKLLYVITLAILMSISGTSCSGNGSVDETADKIDRAISAGNLDQAQTECDRLFSKRSDLQSMSVPELCRMAIIMAGLAEDSEEKSNENAAQAVLCYRTAVEMDSVQAMQYFHSLPSDEYRHVYFLNQLLRPITDREDGVIYVSEDEEWAADSTKID